MQRTRQAYQMGYGDGFADRGDLSVNYDRAEEREAYREGWEAGAARLHDVLDEEAEAESDD